MKRLAILLLAFVACGDNQPPPIFVSSGRMTARLDQDPAQITLLVDGAVVWQTESGDGDGTPPHGFAAIDTRSVTVEMQFGSFKFTDNSDQWQSIGRIGNVVATADGATFTLSSGDTQVGTGTLTFLATTGAGMPGQVRIQLVVDRGDSVSISTPCPTTEHVVGLGGQSFDVDHRGLNVPLWVQEDGIGKEPDPDDDYDGVWFLSGRRHSTHSPQPMLLSSRGYALAVDTNARAVFDLGAEHPDSARFEAWERTLDLNVFVGDPQLAAAAPRDALGHMIAWVGKPVRPPDAVFAPWVDAIFGSTNVRAVAQALRDNGVAASVIWTEDWRGGGDTTTGYALDENWRVDRTLYPDFEQLASDLHGEGFQFLVYNNTFLDSSGDVYAEAVAGNYGIHDATGATYTFNSAVFDPASLVDLTSPDAVTWAKGVMGEGLALGADGWMADFGEWQPTDAILASGEDALAVHNRYPVDWATFNHDLLATPMPGRPQPIYFMRSAWIHSQPMVQVLWPGDQQTDFSLGDGFPSVIPMGIGLGLTGFPYFGSDIAGYMSQGTTPTDEELFYRWVTFGALSPVMRTHHGRSARENFQWQHDTDSIAHFRRWTRFHQQLAAYLEGSIGSFERDGVPLFRLTALEFPTEDWAWSSVDEYMLGDRILVAPIQVEGDTTRAVTLPAGTDWFPLLGAAAVSGSITASAAMTEIPAYVPAGSMLVLYPDGIDTVLDTPSLTTLSTVGNDREVWLWPGAALDRARASWHDTDGPTGAAQWTWIGRAEGASIPTSATWNDAPITVTANVGYATITVTGDGTLQFSDGGTLVIARGDATASVVVRIYGQ